MTSRAAASEKAPLASGLDFSLVLGGPLFQLLRRGRLSDDALDFPLRRIAFFGMITWAPLPVLAAAQGLLFGGARSMPFLNDLECHLRFLVAVPLLIIAEVVVHRRLRPMIGQFEDRGLVPPDQMPRFADALSEARRLRNSAMAEVILIILVYAVGIWVIWRQYVALDTGTWYYAQALGGERLSLAGLWFGFVSLPMFQFLLLRWYFRLFIWAKFMFRMSQLNLDLKPAHPDKAGGLGFLGGSLYAFIPIAAAHGVLLAGLMADRIFYTGAKLADFELEVFVVVAALLVLFAGPMTVFAPMLSYVKRRGLSEYGALAQSYVGSFDSKWIHGGVRANERLIGSSDIQSLADLANSYAVVQQMRLTPVSRLALLQFGCAILVPVLPLVLTMMPAEKLIRRLVGMVV
jgi:hypothetical protein